MVEFSISEGSFNPVAAIEDTRSLSRFTASDLPPAPAAPKAPPPVGFDEITNKVFVNGFEFDADDHNSALKSKEYLRGPLRTMPINYRPVDAEEFGGYIKRIQDPSIGRIIKKNFGIGIDNLQLLGGRGLQYADPILPFDANKAGQKIVDQQVEDLEFTAPYQRVFTDIDSAGGAIEWFLANLAQQGPMLIESTLSAAAGFVAGGIVGGNPLSAIGGAFLALSGKAAVKQAVIAAAKKKAAGEVLDIADKKLLNEFASVAVAQELRINAKKISPVILGEAGLIRGSKEALKRLKLQQRTGGAMLGSQASNLGIGVSDIYGEQIESGTENRLEAFSLAIPYSLSETLPELLGLGFFIKGGRSLATSAVVAGRGARALKRVGRGAAAGTVAAAGEGTTEAFQEALLLSQNPEVSLGSKEGMNRLVNSFAAGAGVGGALGVVGGTFRPTRDLDSDNVDILNPTLPPIPSVEDADPTQLELFPGEDLGQTDVDTERQAYNDRVNLIGERNSLFDESERIRRRVEELITEFQEMEATGVIDVNRVSNIRQEIQRLDTAMGELTGVLGADVFAGLPSRVAELSERLNQQDRLPFAPAPTPPVTPAPAPTPPVTPAPALTPPVTPAPAQGELLLEGGQAISPPSGEQLDLALPETVDPRQGQLNLQPSPINPAMKEAFQRAQEQRAKDQLPKNTVQEVQFQQNLPQLPLPVEPVPDQLFTGSVPQEPLFSPTGEEMIAMPVLIQQTGEVVNFNVTAKQAITEAKYRVDSLLDLRTCLKG